LIRANQGIAYKDVICVYIILSHLASVNHINVVETLKIDDFGKLFYVAIFPLLSDDARVYYLLKFVNQSSFNKQ